MQNLPRVLGSAGFGTRILGLGAENFLGWSAAFRLGKARSDLASRSKRKLRPETKPESLNPKRLQFSFAFVGMPIFRVQIKRGGRGFRGKPATGGRYPEVEPANLQLLKTSISPNPKP